MRTILTSSTASLRSTFRAPLAALILTGATSLLALGGCKDADLEARTEAQSTIVKVSNEFSTAMAKYSATASEESVRTLNSLQSEIDRLNNPSGEQRAAAGLLSAAISQATADIQGIDAFQAMRKIQQERLYAAAMADAAATLRDIANAQKSFSLATEKTRLKEEATSAAASLKQAQDALQQLEGPVAQLKARIEERRGEIAALQQNIEELRRQAIEKGAIAGLPLIEQAATIKGSVRSARSDAATQELELSKVEPEQVRANLAHEGAKSLKSAAASALDKLENLESVISGEAAETQKAADATKSLAETALGTIATANEELKAAYSAIEASLNKASSGANNANSGGGSVRQSAKFAKITALSSLASLYAEQAANATSQLQLHQALAGAGDLFGGNAKQADAIAALTAERDEALAKAKEQLVDAIGQVGEAGDGDSSQVRGLRNSLNSLLARVEGREAAPAGAPTNTGAQSGGAATSAGAVYLSGSGLASLAEFQQLFGGEDMELGIAKLPGAFRSTTPSGRAMIDGMVGLLNASQPLYEAVKEKWGVEGLKRLSSSSPLAGGGQVTPGPATDSRAEFQMTNPAGQTQTWVLIKEGNAWFVQIESILPGGEAALAQAPQAADMMVGMFKSMAAALNKSVKGIVDRIKSGEISNPEQLTSELAQAMMSGMMPGGGR